MKKRVIFLVAAMIALTGCTTSEKEAEVTSVINQVTVESQKVDMPGVKNARELGGYITQDGSVIKEGMLLRSAAISDADAEQLKQITEKLNVSDIIDLRAGFEVEENPEPEVEGVNIHWIEIMDEQQMIERIMPYMEELYSAHDDPAKTTALIVESGILSDQMYVEFLQSDIGVEGYKKFFEVLVDNDEQNAVLWHCTNGKDRTGVAAMLLLGVLGVDEDTIMKDFMLTNEFFADEINALKSEIEGKLSEDLMEHALVGGRAVSEKYMTEAIEYIEKEYGSITGYVMQRLELTDSDIEKLKDIYTEER